MSIKKTSHNIFVLTAKDQKTLQELALTQVSFLEQELETPLADICERSRETLVPLEHRLAIVAESTRQVRDNLTDFASQSKTMEWISHRVHPQTPKVAFLFTGQGSQYFNMGRQLYETQTVFREAIDYCSEFLASKFDYSLLEILYFPSSASDSQDTELINLTTYTQPALFALEYALTKLWQSWGIVPDVVMGHSIGEYVAACIAGVFSLEDGLSLVANRGRLMQNLPQDGAMIVVMTSADQLTSILQPYGEKVAIAAVNGVQNVVISGQKLAIQEIAQKLELMEIKVTLLKVSHAFHSPLMQPMIEEFASVAAKVCYSSPTIPVISNVSGKLAAEELANPKYWCDHICQPVQFAAGIETIYQQGYELFLEIGPRPVLSGMGQQCLPEGFGVWLASLRPEQADLQQILTSLGELYARGFQVDWQKINQNSHQDFSLKQRRMMELVVTDKIAKLENSEQSPWREKLESVPDSQKLAFLKQSIQQVVGEVLTSWHSTGSGTNLQQHIPQDMLNRPFKVVDEWFKYFGVGLETEISKLAAEETVLDLCCGYGVAANTLAQQFSHLNVTGVDLNPDETQVRQHLSLEPQESLPAKLVAHDACQMLSIETNSIDLCYCMAGIAYVPDGLKMLQETYRILKPGGRAFFYIMRRDDDIAKDISLTEIAQSAQGGKLIIHPFSEKTKECWKLGIIPRPYYEDGVTLEIIKEGSELIFPFKFEGSAASLNSPKSRSMEAYYVVGQYTRLSLVS